MPMIQYISKNKGIMAWALLPCKHHLSSYEIPVIEPRQLWDRLILIKTISILARQHCDIELMVYGIQVHYNSFHRWCKGIARYQTLLRSHLCQEHILLRQINAIGTMRYWIITYHTIAQTICPNYCERGSIFWVHTALELNTFMSQHLALIMIVSCAWLG